MLEALKAAPDFPRKQVLIAKALNVLREQVTQGYLCDKWHISPYYTSAHAVIALAGLDDDFAGQLTQWLLATQQKNGSWTFFPSYPAAATEETAYALLALMYQYKNGHKIPWQQIERGIHFLEGCDSSEKALPLLWIAKVLYAPYLIVESAIFAAFAQ